MPGGANEIRRRGPEPNPNRGRPSGYRVTDRQRFELRQAGVFFGTESLQDTIDIAVQEFLNRMRGVPGFSAALASAEAFQRNLAGVATLDATRRSPVVDALNAQDGKPESAG